MPLKEKVERKLAAIMFTDIANYTAISAKDSQKALQLLDNQNEIVKPILDNHNGNLLKEIGDGLLITFESVTSAVECAIEIQKLTKDIENEAKKFKQSKLKTIFIGGGTPNLFDPGSIAKIFDSIIFSTSSYT